MRNLTAIAAAFGLLVTMSVSTIAAPSNQGATTELSVAAKKPTAAACKKNPKLKGCDAVRK